MKQRLSNSASTSFKIDHSDLKCFKMLSCGGRKEVYRGEWLGQEAAIAIFVSCYGEICDIDNLVKKEAELLLKLQHPNIVVCYGYSYTHDAPWPASKHKAEPTCYLVLELMEEDLWRPIDKHRRGPLAMSVALDILLQIVEAMVHLHEHNVMHRNLIPGNCLVKRRSIPSSIPQVLDVYYDVKLAGFGSAITVAPGDAKSKQTLNMGAPRWMAPEMMCPLATM